MFVMISFIKVSLQLFRQTSLLYKSSNLQFYNINSIYSLLQHLRLMKCYSSELPINSLTNNSNTINFNKFKTFLTDILQCKDDIELDYYLQLFPKLLNIELNQCKEAISLLRSLGINDDIIKDYPWVLNLSDNIIHNYKVIKEYDLLIEQISSKELLFFISLNKMYFIAHIPKMKKVDNIKLYFENIKRLCDILCKELETSESHILYLFSNVPEIIKNNENNLAYKLRFLKEEANLSNKNILNDCNILRYSLNTYNMRLQKLKEVGVTKFMPWMFKCTSHKFKSLIEKHLNQQKILQGQTIVEYLAKKLLCDIKEIEELSPSPIKVKIFKLERNINLLLSLGYTTQNILSSPRSLLLSTSTLKFRYNQCGRIPLSLLCAERSKYIVSLIKVIKSQIKN